MTTLTAGCLSIACLALATTLAQAEPLPASSESDALYFQALPYLNSINEEENRIFTLRSQLAKGEAFPQTEKERYKNTLQHLLKEAAPLIKRSSDLGNPAAQYRLAELSATFEDRDQVVGQVCSLLKASLKQGFAPAGLRMLSYCFDDVATLDYRALIDALPDTDTRYGQYYPQPVVMQLCTRTAGSATNEIILPMDEKAVRAELYLSLATQMSRQHLKVEQQHYIQRAANYGCARAVERLKINADG